MNIVSLTAENFKRLKAVRITPDGAMVIIGGNNAQGKSSVLDAIAAALGGADAAPDQPVRIGAESGAVVIDLGDIIVRRTFAVDGKSNLTVTSKEGAKFSSPQSMLDKLIGRLSFDPLAFARQDAKAQLATLKAMLGLDFATQDAERKRIYDERTAIGAVGKSAKARLDAMPAVPADTPDAEVNVGDLLAKLQEANNYNASYAAATSKLQAHVASRVSVQNEITQLEAKLAEARERMNRLDLDTAALEDDVRSRKLADTSAIQAQIAAAETTNRAVRAAAQRKQLEAEVDAQAAAWKQKTAAIDAIDTAKTATIAATTMPVPGLSLNDTGVLYNNVPFSQASSAEQLRVSVAMGLAMNPKLKVVLIRDGSLLDAASMALVAAEAEKHGAQVWMERVGTGSEVGVVIEDGEVAS